MTKITMHDSVGIFQILGYDDQVNKAVIKAVLSGFTVTVEEEEND